MRREAGERVQKIADFPDILSIKSRLIDDFLFFFLKTYEIWSNGHIWIFEDLMTQILLVYL